MASMRLSRPSVAGRNSSPFLQGRRSLSKVPVPRVCLSDSWELGGSRFRGVTFNAASRKLSVSMRLNGDDVRIPGYESNTALKFSEDQSVKTSPSVELVEGKPGADRHENKEVAPQQRKGAKLHDFCLGIPFGGIVFVGGLIGFLFSRNPASLTTGMLLGGATMALGIFSLKVWRQGKSSLPFILGQAVIAATLLWKHLQLYSSTKKLLPSGFYVFLSAAMLCFYSYVLIAGGNPPPKKKPATSPAS